MRFAISISIFAFATALHAADPLAGLDEAVAKGMKAHNVVGLGIAVVQNGKVIHAKGYGLKEVGKSDPVTENTIFAIGSVSKSFTATALAMLVDEKKISFNNPISKRLPTFRLSDAYLSQEATIRDALSHRIGYARNEMVWYGSPFDREQIIGKLFSLKPEIPFRTGFRYNNMMYMAAGQVIPAVTKVSWDQFVTERIFQPLHMESACTSISELTSEMDVATPHERVKGKPTAIPWKDIDNIGPAGSINASASDMAEYVKFHLAGGKAHGKRLLDVAIHEELISPQNLMPKPPFSLNPGAISHSYGMGWMLSDFKGKPIAEHGGNIDGMTAQVGMIPSEKFGVVILANAGQSLLPMALMYDLFDRFTGEPNPDRAATTGLIDALNSVGMEKLVEPDVNQRVKDTKPSLAIKKYAGTYRDDKHADFMVKAKDDQLTATFNGMTFNLEHWHFDTFKGKDPKGIRPGVLITFVIGADGKVAELRFNFAGEVKLPRVGIE